MSPDFTTAVQTALNCDGSYIELPNSIRKLLKILKIMIANVLNMVQKMS